ncbi:MAG: type II toxin-antitoxin system VapC family toxin [Nitrososphaerota archaeon]
MLKVVIDASIVVKWFVEEENYENALKIRDKYVEGEIDIIAPEIIIFEVLNALYYKKLFTLLELKEIANALDAFSFKLFSLKGKYAEKAIEIAIENNITIYDSSYISLALMEKCKMYTADEQLIKKLDEKYLNIVKNIKGIDL